MLISSLVENVLRTLDLLDPEAQIDRNCHALEDSLGVIHRFHRDPLMLLLMNIEHPTHGPEVLNNARQVVISLNSLLNSNTCDSCFFAEDAVLLSLVEAEFGEAAYALFTANRLSSMNINQEFLSKNFKHSNVDSLVESWLKLCETLTSEADGLFNPSRRDWELIIEHALDSARSNLKRVHRDLFTHPTVVKQLREHVSSFYSSFDVGFLSNDTDELSLVGFVTDSLSNHEAWLSTPTEITERWPFFALLRNLTVAYAPETVDHIAVAQVPTWVAEAIFRLDPTRMRSRLHYFLSASECETAAKLFVAYGRDEMYNSFDTCVETARALMR